LDNPTVTVNRIVQQLQLATGGTIGTQKNDNPRVFVPIKGSVKTADIRLSPNGTLPGGAKGGAEFRVGIGAEFLTFGGKRVTDKDTTHFWLGSQVYDPDVTEAMVFTMLNQYYQNSFSPPAPTYP